MITLIEPKNNLSDPIGQKAVQITLDKEKIESELSALLQHKVTVIFIDTMFDGMQVFIGLDGERCRINFTTEDCKTIDWNLEGKDALLGRIQSEVSNIFFSELLERRNEMIEKLNKINITIQNEEKRKNGLHR